MNIDWSKAPKWADEVGTVNGGSPAWLSESGYCFHGISNPPCHPYKGENYTRDLFTVVARRPWNGSGIPPVDTVCESGSVRNITTNGVYTEHGKRWCSVRVIAHAVADGIEFAIAQGDDEIHVGKAGDFRISRTAEQIAAEEREAAIKVMVKDSQPDYSAGELLNASEYVECAISALYDAGYRKQDNGARGSKVEPIEDMADLALGKKVSP